jgi:alkylhydroperoxidase/carboxymuconolactone decarboxylase family protein YurZ
MDDRMTDAAKSLVEQAAQAGMDSFMATFGRFPDRFRLLHEHAPGAFAGYGLMRNALMQEKPAGALDMKTKELLFAMLDTLHGDKYGATNHAIAAMKLGLTLPELAEGLVQVIMVGGITTWNLVGYELMQACIEHAKGVAPAATP